MPLLRHAKLMHTLRDINTGKGALKLQIFANNRTVYLENLTLSTKNGSRQYRKSVR